MFTEDYLRFEKDYLKELENLFYKTGDELLRLEILKIRDILFRIYYTHNFKRYSAFDLSRAMRSNG